MPGEGSAGQVLGGNLGTWGKHRLWGLWEGPLGEVRCCKCSSTHVWGEAELEHGWGIGWEECRGLGIWLQGSEECLGMEGMDCFGWETVSRVGLGLEMWLGFGILAGDLVAG